MVFWRITMCVSWVQWCLPLSVTARTARLRPSQRWRLSTTFRSCSFLLFGDLDYLKPRGLGLAAGLIGRTLPRERREPNSLSLSSFLSFSLHHSSHSSYFFCHPLPSASTKAVAIAIKHARNVIDLLPSQSYQHVIRLTPSFIWILLACIWDSLSASRESVCVCACYWYAGVWTSGEKWIPALWDYCKTCVRRSLQILPTPRPRVIFCSECGPLIRSSLCPVSLLLEHSLLCQPKHLFSISIWAFGLTLPRVRAALHII